ncbi:MAG: hypothetical protein KGI98_11925 [Euryarchaeota archaeon]|nr:hypothetical protein [Euryarchaeota archaeon]MDE1881588.1 hypothetical protein [Euryarchaeota archaeon]
MAELRGLPYTPELKDLEKAGIRVEEWIWNPHWEESWRHRDEVNGGKPTAREVRLYRRRLTASFHRLFEGRCSGCGRFFRLRQLVLDHNHDTGLVRGAICYSCNTADELATPPLPPTEVVTEHGLLIRTFEPEEARRLYPYAPGPADAARDADILIRRLKTEREVRENFAWLASLPDSVFDEATRWVVPDCCLCGGPEHIGTPCEKEVGSDGLSS